MGWKPSKSLATLMPWRPCLPVKGQAENPGIPGFGQRLLTDCLNSRGALQLPHATARNRFRRIDDEVFRGRDRIARRARRGVKYLGPDVLWMRFERRLGAMSALGSTIVLSAIAVVMAALSLISLLYFDGAKLTPLAFSNIVVETLAVAVPLILYSRRVITQLEKSRSQTARTCRAGWPSRWTRPSSPTAPNPPSSPI